VLRDAEGEKISPCDERELPPFGTKISQRNLGQSTGRETHTLKTFKGAHSRGDEKGDQSVKGKGSQRRNGPMETFSKRKWHEL